MNTVYVLQPAAGKHGLKNVGGGEGGARHHDQHTYNSKLGRVMQEENKLMVSLGYTVRPCLKSHKRKAKQKKKKKPIMMQTIERHDIENGGDKKKIPFIFRIPSYHSIKMLFIALQNQQVYYKPWQYKINIIDSTIHEGNVRNSRHSLKKQI